MPAENLERVLKNLGASFSGGGDKKCWTLREGSMTWFVRTSRLNSLILVSLLTPVQPDGGALEPEFYARMQEIMPQINFDFGSCFLMMEDAVPVLRFNSSLWFEKQPTRQGLVTHLEMCASSVRSILMMLHCAAAAEGLYGN